MPDIPASATAECTNREGAAVQALASVDVTLIMPTVDPSAQRVRARGSPFKFFEALRMQLRGAAVDLSSSAEPNALAQAEIRIRALLLTVAMLLKEAERQVCMCTSSRGFCQQKQTGMLHISFHCWLAWWVCAELQHLRLACETDSCVQGLSPAETSLRDIVEDAEWLLRTVNNVPIIQTACEVVARVALVSDEHATTVFAYCENLHSSIIAVLPNLSAVCSTSHICCILPWICTHSTR